MTASEPRIWFKDPVGFILCSREELASFIPERDSPIVSQLNAVMRFALYLALIILLMRRSLMVPMAILVTAGLATYSIFQSSNISRDVVLERMRSLSVEEDPVTGRICSSPTLNNPYMNVLMTDVTSFPDRPPACDITQSHVRRRADDLQAHNLYIDSDDIYGHRSISRHPFYTNPVTTVPNDQTAFAQWLYGSGPTCRDGFGDACASQVFHQRASW